MNRFVRNRMFGAVAGMLMFTAPAAAQIQQIWNNPWNVNTTVGPSKVTTAGFYSEVADDFEAVAAVTRVIAQGHDDFCSFCQQANIQGVFVRFYQWTDAGPGALQEEYYFASGDPGFGYIAANPEVLDINLSPPFGATGKHFISVQLHLGQSFGPGGTTWHSDWGFRGSNDGNPTLSPAMIRSAADGQWAPYIDYWGQLINTDVALRLFGETGDEPLPSLDPCGDWQVVPMPVPPGATRSGIGDIAVIAPDDIWAVGHYQTTGLNLSTQTFAMSMHWDGESWTLIDTPSPTQCEWCSTHVALSAVAHAPGGGPGDLWAAGIQKYTPPIPFAGNGIHIIVMRWNGSEWQVMDTPLLGGGSGDAIAAIKAFAPDDIWFIGSGHPGTGGGQFDPSLAIHWNGSEFNVVPTPFINTLVWPHNFGEGNSLKAVDGVAPDDVWAVGAAYVTPIMTDSQILHWDGSEWNHRPGPVVGSQHELRAVKAIASDDVWAGGEFLDANGYQGLALHWDGDSWTQVPVPGTVNAFHAFASDDVYAVGGRIMHWNGKEWSIVETLPSTSWPFLTGITATGPCELWAVGSEQIAGSRFAVSARITPALPSLPTGDLNGDELVGVADLLILLASWGPCPRSSDCPADLNGDGVVGVSDLLLLLANWG